MYPLVAVAPSRTFIIPTTSNSRPLLYNFVTIEREISFHEALFVVEYEYAQISFPLCDYIADKRFLGGG